jgi:hypothetical protein
VLSEKLNGWFSTLVDKVCSPADGEFSAHLRRAVILQRCAPTYARHSQCHHSYALSPLECACHAIARCAD